MFPFRRGRTQPLYVPKVTPKARGKVEIKTQVYLILKLWSPDQVVWKCSLQTSGISITENPHPQHPAPPTPDLLNGILWGVSSTPCFTKPSRWFWCSPKFEKHHHCPCVNGWWMLKLEIQLWRSFEISPSSLEGSLKCRKSQHLFSL